MVLEMRSGCGWLDEPQGRRSQTAVTGARSIGLLFTDREAFRIIDLLRPFYAMTAVVAFFVTEAGRYVYRPLLHEMACFSSGST